ncbi:DNRLRE domain-containing protein (plasmid) [Streptomyces goshikiensis]|uniref:DNRLRE domain-containing protein n=1 Tax=Streptomyces goshikiensis TaxID=1942 RepID=A0ABZ1RXG7_9ACTN|nr:MULTISPECIES: DNRLRE domain-containing protein [Streptomyces]PJN17696.1 hypothetical protein CG724_19170 [Streptomyces sp. CB02120-2]
MLAAVAVLATAALAVPLGIHLTSHDKGKPVVAKRPASPVEAPEASREAKKTGKDVEVTAERTANSTTWAKPDGQMKMRVHNNTVRAKVGGEWKAIDTTLERVEGGYAPKAVNNPLVFSPGTAKTAGTPKAAGASADGRASRAVDRTILNRPGVIPAAYQGPATGAPEPEWTELVRLSSEGHDVVVKWPGKLPAPVIDGPRALYENVRPDIDLLLTARDGGYGHVLIVHNKQAAADPLLSELNYRLSSPDLTFRMDPESKAVSARDSEGQEIAASPSPFMWDSAGETRATEGEKKEVSPLAKDHPALGLPALGGPQTDAHTGLADAELTADNTLKLIPDTRLINDADTVYPLLIDPPFTVRKHSWTLLYAKYPNSSFFNGQNFNDGTNEARVGYESDTSGLSRSVFNFYLDSRLHGATITKAQVRLLQTYSWSCNKYIFDVHGTPLATSSSTWKNSTGAAFWSRWIAAGETGHGWNSSCPDSWVGVNVLPMVQDAATNGWPSMSLGLRAKYEDSAKSWAKFLANGESAPYLDIEFNRPPEEPTQADMQTFPGGTCSIGTPVPSIGKSDLTFQAKSSDPDGNLKSIYIDIWRKSDGATVFANYLEPDSSGTVKVTIPWSSFTHNAQYSWAASAYDTDGAGSAGGPAGTNSRCTFTVDHVAPSSPALSSTDFPAPGPDGAEWSAGRFPAPGTVRFLGNGAKADEIREYQWSINRPTFDQKAAPSEGDTATAQVTPQNAGPNVIYARTVDKAGNVSAPSTYLFYVRPGDKLDSPGDVTGDAMPDILAVDASGNLLTYAGDNHGDVDASMPAATDAGRPVPDGYWKDTATGKSALIGHSTDWFPGDGITDLIARMPDGKLYAYPGDGSGRFDISRRMDILMPAGSPDPATFTQIITTEDVTGDKIADVFAVTDTGTLWALNGYTGASFSAAQQIGGTDWAKRDIIHVRDVSGDGVPDLVFRDDATPSRGLALRKGKPGAKGGVDLNSLASAGASNGGQDITYGTTSWNRATWPLLRGTPDVTGDGVPDFWVTNNDGSLFLYAGGTTSHGDRMMVGTGGWNTIASIG